MSDAVICPVCRSVKTSLLWSVTSVEAAQHFILSEKDRVRNRRLSDEITRLWSKASAATYRCGRCGFCFASPYVAGGEAFYRLAYDENKYPAWKWEFQLTLDKLKSQKPEVLRLLEIGAGEGSFVAALLKTGVLAPNILCTEYSPHGREKIEKLGVKCLAIDVRDIDSGQLQDRFDAICMFQVLEHLDRLDELFMALKRMLRPGGSVFIAVPNSLRIDFNERNGALLDMPPNHIGRWSRECFAIICERHGMHIESHVAEPLKFWSTLEELSYFRFLRSAQRNGSIPNKIHSIRNRPLRKLLEVFAVGLSAMRAFPIVVGMGFEMGSSQWVHITTAK
jgi:SAM-dependent methyltransferase